MAEAGELAGLSVSHMRYLARNGKLESRKIGRDWVTTRDAVERYGKDEEARSRNPYKSGKRRDERRR